MNNWITFIHRLGYDLVSRLRSRKKQDIFKLSLQLKYEINNFETKLFNKKLENNKAYSLIFRINFGNENTPDIRTIGRSYFVGPITKANRDRFSETYSNHIFKELALIDEHYETMTPVELIIVYSAVIIPIPNDKLDYINNLSLFLPNDFKPELKHQRPINVPISMNLWKWSNKVTFINESSAFFVINDYSYNFDLNENGYTLTIRNTISNSNCIPLYHIEDYYADLKIKDDTSFTRNIYHIKALEGGKYDKKLSKTIVFNSGIIAYSDSSLNNIMIKGQSKKE